MNQNYYGTKKLNAISYLEFGAIDLQANKKDIWEFKLHNKAYDWLMLARYANDLVAYLDMNKMVGHRSLEKITDIYKNEIHHQDDASLNLGKLVALMTIFEENKNSGKLSFFELGQTIFGCIEGMEFYFKLLKSMDYELPNIDLLKIDWYGIDISKFFNKISILMHQKYRIYTKDKLSFINSQKSVFFAKGVTLLYAVRTVGDLLSILSKSKLSIFDYSFSLSEDQDIVIGSGKTIRYLKFDKFYKIYNKSNNKLFVRKHKSNYSPKTGRLFLDCLYGEESICNKFIKKDCNVRQYLYKRLSSVPESLILLDIEKGQQFQNEWVTIDKFMESIQ